MGLPKWLSRYSWHTFARCHPAALQPGAWPTPVSTASSSGLAAVLRCFEGLELEPWWYDLEWCQWCLLAAFQFFFWLAPGESWTPLHFEFDQKAHQSPTGFQQSRGLFRPTPSYSGFHHYLRWRCWQPAMLVVLATRRRLGAVGLGGTTWQPLATNDFLMLIVWMKYEWTVMNMPFFLGVKFSWLKHLD